MGTSDFASNHEKRFWFRDICFRRGHEWMDASWLFAFADRLAFHLHLLDHGAS
jgi:hypothetical protein